MINNIFSLFGVHRTGMLMGIASNVIKAFEQEYAQDGNALGAAIDSLILLLQQHKVQVSAKTPAAPIPVSAPQASLPAPQERKGPKPEGSPMASNQGK